MNMIEQALRQASINVSKALYILTNPNVFAKVFGKETGPITNILQNPKTRAHWVTVLMKIQSGLQGKGRPLNLYIDNIYNSGKGTSLYMVPVSNALATWYPATEPIHVVPSYFNVSGEQQAKDMVHELGRYFAGITAHQEEPEMIQFDEIMSILLRKYTYNHLP